MNEGLIVGLMAFLFVLFGVLGVPVPFAVMASVMIGVLLTDISMTTVVAEMFNGINAVPLLAVPFFILAGELMASSNVTERLVTFAQALVGHIRGGWRRWSRWSACSLPGSPAPPRRTSRPSGGSCCRP